MTFSESPSRVHMPERSLLAQFGGKGRRQVAIAKGQQSQRAEGARTERKAEQPSERSRRNILERVRYRTSPQELSPRDMVSNTGDGGRQCH